MHLFPLPDEQEEEFCNGSLERIAETVMRIAEIPSRCNRRRPVGCVCIPAGSLLVLLLAVPLSAQVNSRAEEIQQARRQKAADTTLEEVSGTEKALNTIKDKKLLERFATGIAGFHLRFGGLATGQGFALGPEYLRQDLADGNLIFRGSASASSHWRVRPRASGGRPVGRDTLGTQCQARWPRATR